MSTLITLTSCSVRASMIYALLARVPPVTTYRPSGDIITMCGLTLFPRNVLPTIFLLLMSMKAISFESRLTIITTVVGSTTLTSAARRPAPVSAAPMIPTAPLIIKNRLVLVMAMPPEILDLKARLQSHTWHEKPRSFGALWHLERMRRVERQS